MYNVVWVKVLKTENDAADKKLYDVFRKFLIFANLEAKISSRHIVHDEVQIVAILESKDHIN